MTELPDMSGLTGKERSLVKGLLADMSDVEAFKQSGYSQNLTSQGMAIKVRDLKKKGHIQAILMQFQRQAAEKAGLTLDSHLEKLSELRDLAVMDKQWAPAIRAEEARGHVAGHRVERVRQEAVPPVQEAVQVMLQEIESTLGEDAAREYARKKGLEWLPARDSEVYALEVIEDASGSD